MAKYLHHFYWNVHIEDDSLLAQVVEDCAVDLLIYVGGSVCFPMLKLFLFFSVVKIIVFNSGLYI